MGDKTGISWCDHTFNPWWGCMKVSPGCENCYALTFSKRVGYDIWGPAKTTARRLFDPKHFGEPLKWDAAARKAGERRRVFCASMADVFEDHPDVVSARCHLWDVIDHTPHLDWLLLTKRPENVRRFMPWIWGGEMPANVWLGTSVEDQQRADERIPLLVGVRASVRFLSAEPLLGPLELGDLSGIQWVIGGGESGGPVERRLVSKCGGAWHYLTDSAAAMSHCDLCDGTGWRPKPAALEWARSLRDQCAVAGAAFHWKQWGGPHHASGGRLLDGREWSEFPTARAPVTA